MQTRAETKNRPPFPSGEVCAIPTCDGSNECTHPSVLDSVAILGRPWHNYRYWMAFTPYPGNTPNRFRLENPSIVASNDGTTWVVPEGVQNPVVPPPGGADLWRSLTTDIPPRLVFWFVRGVVRRMSFNADPSLSCSPDGEMALTYVHTIKGGGHDEIVVVSSSDGWRSRSRPQVVVRCFREPGTWEINVPTVVDLGEGGSRFVHLYYGYVPLDEDGKRPRYDRLGLRKRSGRTLSTLGEPVPIAITMPPGHRLWHHEIRPHPDGQLLCMGTFAPDTDAPHQMTWPPTLALYSGEFVDETTLVFDDRPILSPSPEGWDSQCIYKPSFLIQRDEQGETVHLWYSAQDARTRCWRTGYTRQHQTDGLTQRGDKSQT